MIKGTITKIFVQKDDDWGVYNIDDIYAKTHKIVGVIPGASVGMTVTVEGKEENTRYGKQFTVSSVLATESDEFAALRRYLSDGYLKVKGLGTVAVNDILSTFGKDTERIIFPDEAHHDASVKALCTVKRIKGARAEDILKGAAGTKKYLALLKAANGALTKNQADRIMDKYGRRAPSIIKKNPYRLITDIKGFGFQKADAIAEGAGVKKNSIQRIEAGITYTIDSAASDGGDCYLFREDIRSRISTMLTPTPRIPDSWVTKVMADNALADWGGAGREKFIKAHNPSAETLQILDDTYMQRVAIDNGFDEAMRLAIDEGYLIDDGGRIFTADMYKREYDIGEMIASMLHKPPVRHVTDKQINQSIKNIEAEKTREARQRGDDTPFKITDEQKEAIERSLSKRISVITGGPGRGKTTIIEAIVGAFLNSGKYDKDCILMLAPTGRAAQRIHEQTGFDASTIHRTIYKYENGRPQLIKDIPEGRLIIVDESSMIDIYLMSSLIKYAAKSQIIFVGDVDQIASVGPGKVLKDLIASKEIPTSVLVKGHRNSGSIAENAAMINKGREIASYTYDSHFVYIPTDAGHIQQTVVNDYIRKVNEYGIKDVLLCTAMRERGPVAVNVLNGILQDIFTKGHKQAKIGSKIFRVGDRVMQTKNNYQFIMQRSTGIEEGVFNGEKGTISQIVEKDGEPALVVVFDDGSVGGYLSSSAADLTLAYATTVHKCQGSEAPCVMMAYTYGDFMLLKRSLFYTGETRAKKEFRFYGEEQWKYGKQLSAFDIAVKKVDDKERNTMLAERIRAAVNRKTALSA